MKPVTLLSNEISKHITPVIRDYFINMYEHPEQYLDPESKDSSSNQLIKFQLALKKIPNWTNTQIKKQIDDIKVRCTWFKNLLTALFVSYINMLSHGLRTNSSKNRRLDVKLPSDEFFVHTCFVTAAHDIYEDPYVMKKQERERNEELDKRIQKSVLDSIHKLIPIQDIISTYIPSVGDDVSFGSEEPEVEPEPEPEPAAPETTTEELKKEEGIDDTEPKTINLPSSSLPQTEQKEEDDDDLFPDAPDKISSKE
jgi:hypothetical protein